MHRSLVLLTSLLVTPGLSGCGHVIHPAAVQPGFTLEVVAGAANVRHEPLSTRSHPSELRPGTRDSSGFLEPPGKFDPYDSWRRALQLGLGYGWRWSGNFGLQLQAGAGNRTAPGLDAYVQVLGRPVDAGVGMIGALGYYGPYALAGKGWRLGPGTELRFDGGARLLFALDMYPVQSWGPMALVSVRRGRFAGGLWADGLFHDWSTYDLYCDETCKPQSFARRRITTGIYLRVGSRLLGGGAE